MTGWQAALSAAPSAETAAFNAALERTLAALPAAHEVAPEVTRAARAAGRGVFPPAGPLATARWVPAATVPGRVRVSLPDGSPRGVVLHVHGGGWTLGAPELFDAPCAALARAAGVAVVSAPYRLAPEHPWPACADDVEAAALWLLAEAPALFGTDRLLVAGESAGAHLALATLLRLRARGLVHRVCGASLSYGCYDLRLTPSMARWGARKLVLSTPTVDWFIENLTAGDRSLRADPAVSPLLADLGGLPPLLVQVGTADPLLDDSTFLAMRLAAAGAPPEVRVWPGGVHAFDQFDIVIAREARAAEAAFVASRLS